MEAVAAVGCMRVLCRRFDHLHYSVATPLRLSGLPVLVAGGVHRCSAVGKRDDVVRYSFGVGPNCLNERRLEPVQLRQKLVANDAEGLILAAIREHFIECLGEQPGRGRRSS